MSFGHRLLRGGHSIPALCVPYRNGFRGWLRKSQAMASPVTGQRTLRKAMGDRPTLRPYFILHSKLDIS